MLTCRKKFPRRVFSETSECPVPGYDRDIAKSFQHLKTIGSILVALSGPILILPERSPFLRGVGGGGWEKGTGLCPQQRLVIEAILQNWCT